MNRPPPRKRPPTHHTPAKAGRSSGGNKRGTVVAKGINSNTAAQIANTGDGSTADGVDYPIAAGVLMTHVVGTPTAAKGSAVGGGVVSPPVGADTNGQLTFTVVTGAAGKIATITFANPFPVVPTIILLFRAATTPPTLMLATANESVNGFDVTISGALTNGTYTVQWLAISSYMAHSTLDAPSSAFITEISPGNHLITNRLA